MLRRTYFVNTGAVDVPVPRAGLSAACRPGVAADRTRQAATAAHPVDYRAHCLGHRATLGQSDGSWRLIAIRRHYDRLRPGR